MGIAAAAPARAMNWRRLTFESEEEFFLII